MSSVAVECRHDDIAVHIESRRRKNGTVGRKYDDDIIVLNINNNYGIDFARNIAFNVKIAEVCLKTRKKIHNLQLF